jgi:hypothetical protein
VEDDARACQAVPTTSSVINTHFEPSFLELNDNLGRSEQYLPGPLPPMSSSAL